MARRKPTITGASVPRRKAMAIKGDTGLYDAVNEGEQKAAIIGNIRMVEDRLERPNGGKKRSQTYKRHIEPRKIPDISVQEPIDIRREGVYTDPFFRERIFDFIENLFKNKTSNNET